MSQTAGAKATSIITGASYDPADFDAALRKLGEQTGTLEVYGGEQVEPGPDGAKVLWMVGEWSSDEAHDKFTKGGPVHPLAEIFLRITGGRGRENQANYAFPPIAFGNRGVKAALDAPMTEIARFKVKSPENTTPLVEILNSFDTLHPDNAWIKTGEGEYIAVLGWATVEAHYDALKAEPKMGEAVKKLMELSTIEIGHVAFKKY